MIAALIEKWLAPYLLQLAIGAAIALAAGGGLIGLKLHYESQGYQRAVDQIAAENQEAIHEVDRARLRVRTCDADGGMRWDQVARDCVRRD